MTISQLNLLGEPDLPEDLDLGPVQREAMRELRRLGSLTRDEAGAVAHEHRGKHGREERCAFCAGDGATLLESLFRRGRAEPVAGAARLPQPKPEPRFDNEIPF